ncbi:MAG: DUF5681 domain-containing protein [Reyranella sp.]
MPDGAKPPTKNGRKTGREATQFQSGNPGGPGRPVGSRNKASILLDKMAESGAQAVLRKQIALAKGGDQRAAELILSRVWPVRKGRPVALDLPAIDTAANIVSALGAVADAVGAGDLTPDEGQAVTVILEAKRRAIETAELESRVSALEQERRK